MTPQEKALIEAALAFDEATDEYDFERQACKNVLAREKLRMAALAYRQEQPTLTRRSSSSHFRAVVEELEKAKAGTEK